MKPFRASLAVAALGTASVAAGYFGFNTFTDVQFARAQERVEATREQLAQVEDLATVFRHVGKVVEPSVVNIKVQKKLANALRERSLPFDDEMLRRFFPDRDGDGEPDIPDMPEDGIQQGTGSGVIMEVVDGAGYIVTNNHVVGDADELIITLADGREITSAKVLGTDPKTDLAVIRIEADKLIPAKWGNSDELDKGDWIMAFGSPFGYVGSMTHGIVSALNRDRVGILGPGGYENFIQVDAPINPGNSGGPLVNIRGEVVGINTAIASRTGGFQGIGFAIPSNQAKYVYQALKEEGKVARGWIGVSIADVSDARMRPIARSFGYEGNRGVLVQETFPGTPAYGKLQPGDIVLALNGKRVGDVNDLRNAIAATPAGTEVTLRVFREGEEEDVKLTVGDQPEDLASAVRGAPGQGSPEGANGTADSMGLGLTTLTDEMAERYGLAQGRGGALVSSVEPRSIAARAGLRPGDLISRIGNKSVNNANEALAALKQANLEEGVRLYVTNREGSRFVFLRSAE